MKGKTPCQKGDFLKEKREWMKDWPEVRDGRIGKCLEEKV
jgi:hypothetical protein